MNTRIFKILPRADWGEAVVRGVYSGAPVDLADGFIHFSAADQVEETAAKHFSGQKDLLIIAFHAEDFGDELKWEPSRGGALFPHLYSKLETAKAIEVLELADREDGGHDFPEKW